MRLGHVTFTRRYTRVYVHVPMQTRLLRRATWVSAYNATKRVITSCNIW